MYFNLFKKNNWLQLIHVLFWLVAIINVWALSRQKAFIDLITIPLFIPLLLLYSLANNKRDSTYFFIQIVSWIGSVLFIGEAFETTMAGLICFWVALLLYTFALLQELEAPFYKRLNEPKRGIALLLYLIYFMVIIFLLSPNLKEWFSSITAYTLTITFLSFIATIHYLEQPTNKFRLFFLLGILLLFLAASIICYQLFNQDNTIISLSVRIIFILAQYLICLYFTFAYRPKKLA